jgi:proteasome lid subunit RPN8/RPN11
MPTSADQQPWRTTPGFPYECERCNVVFYDKDRKLKFTPSDTDNSPNRCSTNAPERSLAGTHQHPGGDNRPSPSDMEVAARFPFGVYILSVGEESDGISDPGQNFLWNYTTSNPNGRLVGEVK